jgi:hypothetical protein
VQKRDASPNHFGGHRSKRSSRPDRPRRKPCHDCAPFLAPVGTARSNPGPDRCLF